MAVTSDDGAITVRLNIHLKRTFQPGDGTPPVQPPTEPPIEPPIEPPTEPPSSAGWDFPRLGKLYSPNTMNSTEGKQAVARYGSYVTDFTWAPLPMGYPAEGDDSVGEYIDSLQPPPSANWVYDHSCMMEWNQAEPGGNSWKPSETGYYVNGRRYRIALEWLLCDAGSTLTKPIDPGATEIPVANTAMFWIGLHAIVGGLGGRPIEMVTVRAKSAQSGAGTLTVVRGEQAQTTAYENGELIDVPGGYPPVAHAAGDAIRPTSFAFGSGEYMFTDVTRHCPTADGGFGPQTYNQWSAAFLALKLGEPHLTYLDGVFLDNFVGEARQIFSNIAAVDLERTNTATGMNEPDWKSGMADHAARCRAVFPAKEILANTGGNSADFREWLNGGMIEGVDFDGSNTLIGGTVVDVLDWYRDWMTAFAGTPRFLFNASSSRTPGGSRTDYQAVRLTLALCLMYDGIYVYDEFLDGNPGGGLNAGGHQSAWWYDEYDNAGAGVGWLGQPLGPASQPVGGVLRRDFDHGSALCNLSNASQVIALGATFTRIAGTQDPGVNDGARVPSVTLPPRDGILLLRAPA